MIHNIINLPPSLQSGLFTLGAAAVTGVFSWLTGTGHGRIKGRAEFINAVEKAAELVITRLEGEIAKISRLHAECEESKAVLAARVDFLMKEGPIAVYHLNRDNLDG